MTKTNLADRIIKIRRDNPSSMSTPTSNTTSLSDIKSAKSVPHGDSNSAIDVVNYKLNLIRKRKEMQQQHSLHENETPEAKESAEPEEPEQYCTEAMKLAIDRFKQDKARYIYTQYNPRGRLVYGDSNSVCEKPSRQSSLTRRPLSEIIRNTREISNSHGGNSELSEGNQIVDDLNHLNNSENTSSNVIDEPNKELEEAIKHVTKVTITPRKLNRVVSTEDYTNIKNSENSGEQSEEEILCVNTESTASGKKLENENKNIENAANTDSRNVSQTTDTIKQSDEISCTQSVELSNSEYSQEQFNEKPAKVIEGPDRGNQRVVVDESVGTNVINDNSSKQSDSHDRISGQGTTLSADVSTADQLKSKTEPRVENTQSTAKQHEGYLDGTVCNQPKEANEEIQKKQKAIRSPRRNKSSNSSPQNGKSLNSNSTSKSTITLQKSVKPIVGRPANVTKKQKAKTVVENKQSNINKNKKEHAGNQQKRFKSNGTNNSLDERDGTNDIEQHSSNGNVKEVNEPETPPKAEVSVKDKNVTSKDKRCLKVGKRESSEKVKDSIKSVSIQLENGSSEEAKDTMTNVAENENKSSKEAKDDITSVPLDENRSTKEVTDTIKKVPINERGSSREDDRSTREETYTMKNVPTDERESSTDDKNVPIDTNISSEKAKDDITGVSLNENKPTREETDIMKNVPTDERGSSTEDNITIGEEEKLKIKAIGENRNLTEFFSKKHKPEKLHEKVPSGMILHETKSEETRHMNAHQEDTGLQKELTLEEETHFNQVFYEKQSVVNKTDNGSDQSKSNRKEIHHPSDNNKNQRQINTASSQPDGLHPSKKSSKNEQTAETKNDRKSMSKRNDNDFNRLIQDYVKTVSEEAGYSEQVIGAITQWRTSMALEHSRQLYKDSVKSEREKEETLSINSKKLKNRKRKNKEPDIANDENDNATTTTSELKEETSSNNRLSENDGSTGEHENIQNESNGEGDGILDEHKTEQGDIKEGEQTECQTPRDISDSHLASPVASSEEIKDSDKTSNRLHSASDSKISRNNNELPPLTRIKRSFTRLHHFPVIDNSKTVSDEYQFGDGTLSFEENQIIKKHPSRVDDIIMELHFAQKSDYSNSRKSRLTYQYFDTNTNFARSSTKISAKDFLLDRQKTFDVKFADTLKRIDLNKERQNTFIFPQSPRIQCRKLKAYSNLQKRLAFAVKQ